ncbi:M48 family metallopeptidase [Brevundimonas subvibrioides]|uniref:Peptidase M48 Ste24p n=1 Tax=Brevundimonas subvibrioides (strain ATCC 15264 / DSM 4735 / LMG 14903 / NBRC 16000 / CB 81) TaxID=633149 RepID=D9QI34_BRESC|nr:M48 family metallopeptidase [Brevundimonas subvibrioides]ADL01292.1 peptidase M48 Ste24p [Brevundimonas subvibrioides ATCC 15264]
MAAVGLQTHIWANNTRSTLLLIGFPVMLTLVLFGLELVLMGFGFLPNSGGTLGQDIGLAVSMLAGTIPLAVVVALVWFAIAWFGNQAMIDVMTGARKVERRDEPQLYNLLENLAISRGLQTPTLRIIDSDSLNAFASGIREGHYSVTVTRGLIAALDRDEMDAVLAHELTHVINKDVRTMIIASIFAGIISVVCQLVFRGLFYLRSGKDNKNAGPLILIGFLIAAVGYVFAIVIRMMLSRTREFVADAGSVELTKNPDAMISALRKVSGRSKLQAPDDVQGMFLDNEREGFTDALFATHPPIEKRIAALIRFGGGRDPGVWDGAIVEAPTTAVPIS